MMLEKVKMLSIFLPVCALSLIGKTIFSYDGHTDVNSNVITINISQYVFNGRVVWL